MYIVQLGGRVLVHLASKQGPHLFEGGIYLKKLVHVLV